MIIARLRSRATQPVRKWNILFFFFFFFFFFSGINCKVYDHFAIQRMQTTKFQIIPGVYTV